MNIIPLPKYGVNNSSNQKLNNPCFNGYLDKSVYTFVENSKKLELKALHEYANSANISISQDKIDYITGTWDKALKILESKARILHEKTVIEVATVFSYDLGPLGGHYNHKTEILRASNPNCINNQDISELNQNELYTTEYRPDIKASDFPNDDICKAKQFLRKIRFINFNNIDKNFYKMETRWLLDNDFIIPDAAVRLVKKFGEEIGIKTSKRFFRQINRHNRRIAKERETKNNNDKVISNTINSLN